jgi:hypothetical protein
MFDSSGEGLIREVTHVEYAATEVNELRVSASVNQSRSGELAASAQHAGRAALKLLAREGLFENSVRLDIKTEPISLPVNGESAQLLFALAAFVHIATELGYGGVDRSRNFAATGVLDKRGNVTAIHGLAAKIGAALDSDDLPTSCIIFYPKQNVADVDVELMRLAMSRGVELCPVERLDEALNRIGFNLQGWWEGSPYKGLSSFGVDESRIFFGRKDETKRLIEQLESRARDGRPGVMVLAASGAGKSSFIAAGVIATLKAKSRSAQIEYAIWRPADAKPSGDAARIDEAMLARSIHANWAKHPPGFMGIGEKSSPETLEALALALADTSLQGRRLIWAVDQFEEVFTQPFTEAARVALAEFLHQLQSMGVWIIAGMRSEFYGQYQSLVDERGSPLLLDTFGTKGEFPLLKMNTTSFHEVVAGPARLADLAFETRGDDKISLLQRILADVNGVQDVLPLLGFAMQKLYEGSALAPVQDEENTHGDSGDLQRQLTFKTYEGNGRLEGAIKVVADERFKQLDDNARIALSSVLDALAVPSDAGESESATTADLSLWPTGSAARKLIDALLDIRVLVPADDGDGKPTRIRVAHESLFRNWPEARKVLAESRIDRINLKLFSERANVWAKQSRPGGLLLANNLELESARKLLLLVPELRGRRVVGEFIETSIRLNNRQRMIVRLSIAATIALLVALLGYAVNEALRASSALEEAKLRTAESIDAKQESDRQRSVADDQSKIARAAEKDAEAKAAEAIDARKRADANLKSLRSAGVAVIDMLESPEQDEVHGFDRLKAKLLAKMLPVIQGAESEQFKHRGDISTEDFLRAIKLRVLHAEAARSVGQPLEAARRYAGVLNSIEFAANIRRFVGADLRDLQFQCMYRLDRMRSQLAPDQYDRKRLMRLGIELFEKTATNPKGGFWREAFAQQIANFLIEEQQAERGLDFIKRALADLSNLGDGGADLRAIETRLVLRSELARVSEARTSGSQRPINSIEHTNTAANDSLSVAAPNVVASKIVGDIDGTNMQKNPDVMEQVLVIASPSPQEKVDNIRRQDAIEIAARFKQSPRSIALARQQLYLLFELMDAATDAKEKDRHSELATQIREVANRFSGAKTSTFEAASAQLSAKLAYYSLYVRSDAGEALKTARTAVRQYGDLYTGDNQEPSEFDDSASAFSVLLDAMEKVEEQSSQTERAEVRLRHGTEIASMSVPFVKCSKTLGLNSGCDSLVRAATAAALARIKTEPRAVVDLLSQRGNLIRSAADAMFERDQTESRSLPLTQRESTEPIQQFCAVQRDYGNALQALGQLQRAVDTLEEAVKKCEAWTAKYSFDFYLRDSFSGLLSNLAKAHAAKNNFTSARSTLARCTDYEFFQCFEPYAAMLESGAGGTMDPTLAAELRARKFNQKRFTVPVKKKGKSALRFPFHVYIDELSDKRPYKGIEAQAIWLERNRGLIVPQDVRDVFIKLEDIARENKVSFPDLAIYALGEAQKNQTETDKAQADGGKTPTPN